MKFIKSSEKYGEYDAFEDTFPSDETSKPRRLPSYYDYAKKQSAKNSKHGGNQSSLT